MNKKVEFVMELGRLLLQSGAETYRIEESMERCGCAFGMKKLEAYATTSVVMLTYYDDEEEQKSHFRRIRERDLDLEKITSLNDLSRKVSHKQVSLEEANKQLRQIEGSSSTISYGLTTIIAGINGGLIALLNNSGALEAIMAFIVVVITFLIIRAIKVEQVLFFKEMAIGMIGATLAVLLYKVIPFNIAPVIVGLMLIAIPSIQMVNAVRDLSSGDLTSGALRGLEAAGLTAALFSGVGIVLSFSKVPFQEGYSSLMAVNPLKAAVLAIMIALLFNIFLKSPMKSLVFTAFASLFGLVTFLFFSKIGFSLTASVFFGALAVAITSELSARICKIPTTAFIVAGFVPLLPGLWFYKSMSLLVVGDLAGYIEPLTQGIAIILAIGFSAAIATIFFRKFVNNLFFKPKKDCPVVDKQSKSF
ncbi:threonine/serine ThrE exporter family protein [Heliorestis acidaminivorans]|nr:threonine/serine exporter family protein [Heliorestis acidaminivorans]